jgi:tRNA(Phe) wybutosine-synthesizing methylase Tyw3
MFDVTAEETIGLAAACRLSPVLHIKAESVQEANRLAGVTWSHLAFSKSA